MAVMPVRGLIKPLPVKPPATPPLFPEGGQQDIPLTANQLRQQRVAATAGQFSPTIGKFLSTPSAEQGGLPPAAAVPLAALDYAVPGGGKAVGLALKGVIGKLRGASTPGAREALQAEARAVVGGAEGTKAEFSDFLKKHPRVPTNPGERG